jgi:hypothetical protein
MYEKGSTMELIESKECTCKLSIKDDGKVKVKFKINYPDIYSLKQSIDSGDIDKIAVKLIGELSQSMCNYLDITSLTKKI